MTRRSSTGIEQVEMSLKAPVKTVDELIETVKKRDGWQTEFIQAVSEVLTTLKPVLDQEPQYMHIMERLIEPERVVHFRVPWIDDEGNLRVNRGFRVQFSSVIGPYKGGLRFHETVNLSIVKFLAFEQIFKNSLTGLPMGGGKGGSDFDPRGKSDREVMAFCQSFATELSRHIGSHTDVPAGDIGVGGREIGYLFGQYKRIRNEWTGSFTGKGLDYGGSQLRPEATGYGTVYFLEQMFEYNNHELKDQKILVSGSGNVAQYATEKLLEKGAKVLTLSDSGGHIYEPDGITKEQLEHVKYLKNEKRARLKEYANFTKTGKFIAGERPWNHPCDAAAPCATQNEIEEQDAKNLAANGCKYVVEGANMPSTSRAIEIYFENGIMYGPGKASNAGGVAVSGLEQSQNGMRIQWSEEEVSERLQGIMKNIFAKCRDAAEKYAPSSKVLNLQAGANVAGFIKIADAMLAQGHV